MSQTIQAQQIKVFEAEIDSSMTKTHILNALKKLENVRIDTTRMRRGYKSVRVSRDDPIEERFSISFDGMYLETIEYTCSSQTYMSPKMKEKLGEI